MSALYHHLKSAELEKFSPVFEAHGITDKTILGLTMQDYSLFGVTSMQDRKKLFQMIQFLKMGESCTSLTENGSESTPVRGASTLTKLEKNSAQKKAPPLKCEPVSSAGFPPSGALNLPLNLSKKSSKSNYNYGVPTASNSASPSRPKINIGDRIEVCVRKRPLNRREVRNEETDVAQVVSPQAIIITEPKTAVDLTKYNQHHQFFFDHVFDETISNEQIYQKSVKKLVESIFHHGKATCFAYGQTGSGKTYTMMGKEKSTGLYLLAVCDIFSMLQSKEFSHLGVWLSFYEIYCGQLFDLLHERKLLHAREDHRKRVCIAGLEEILVHDSAELLQFMNVGNSCRSTGANSTNSDSSRSHAVLQIELKTREKKPHGKISFIDLAGSERAADTKESDKQTRMEGAEINQSLLALKECIRALDQVQKHTPFRQSKLTQVLRDSLIGQNARTCMIANISPNSGSSEHTLNTLRYAYRVKELKKSDCGGGGGREEPEGDRMRVEERRDVCVPDSPAFLVPDAEDGLTGLQYSSGLLEEEPPVFLAQDFEGVTAEAGGAEGEAHQSRQDIAFLKEQAGSLISIHKKQLTEVTEFCKQEMQLLQHVEASLGRLPLEGVQSAEDAVLLFGDYVEKISCLLEGKLLSVCEFRSHVTDVYETLTGVRGRCEI